MWEGDVFISYLSDMEFKQRQPEVEKGQVTMALKMGEGMYGEVSEEVGEGQCREHALCPV